MALFSLKDGRPCRLVLAETGPHRFGGPPAHAGATPPNTDTALHHFLSLDLTDPDCSVQTESGIRFLPLYYPLKYGEGGAELQYTVLSDTAIKLLHLDPALPDNEDRQYIRVPVLPQSQAAIVPLEYEEARTLSFVGGYFQPGGEDTAILDRLDYNNLIFIGEYRRAHLNAVCRNPQCEFFGRRIRSESVAIIPPITMRGSNDFWYQWLGAEFHFRLCYYCGTIIAISVAS